MRITSAVLSGLLSVLLLGGCSTHVDRIDPASVTDLSGRWNDTDSRLVARALIEQSLSGPWSHQYMEAHGGSAPTVLVASFRNGTAQHISVETFVNDLERALIGAPQVQLVAGGGEREALRAERRDQQRHARVGDRARLAHEIGADYLLTGEVSAIEDAEGRERVIFYQIDATLTDVTSNVIVWAGSHEIKKHITRPRVSW